MRKLITFTFFILGVAQTFSHLSDSTFYYLVCQQCSSWCSVEQGIPEGPTRVGKAGPRGDVGPPGPPGEVNMTAIEELIERKIRDGEKDFNGGSRRSV